MIDFDSTPKYVLKINAEYLTLDGGLTRNQTEAIKFNLGDLHPLAACAWRIANEYEVRIVRLVSK